MSSMAKLIVCALVANFAHGGRMIKSRKAAKEVKAANGTVQLAAESTHAFRDSTEAACISEEAIENKRDALLLMPRDSLKDTCAWLDATIAYMRELEGCEYRGRKVDAAAVAAQEANLEYRKTGYQCGQAEEDPVVTKRFCNLPKERGGYCRRGGFASPEQCYAINIPGTVAIQFRGGGCDFYRLSGKAPTDCPDGYHAGPGTTTESYKTLVTLQNGAHCKLVVACSEEAMKNKQDAIKSMPQATTEDRCASLDATIAFLSEFDGCEIQGRKIDAAAEEAKMEAAKTSLQCGQAMVFRDDSWEDAVEVVNRLSASYRMQPALYAAAEQAWGVELLTGAAAEAVFADNAWSPWEGKSMNLTAFDIKKRGLKNSVMKFVTGLSQHRFYLAPGGSGYVEKFLGKSQTLHHVTLGYVSKDVRIVRAFSGAQDTQPNPEKPGELVLLTFLQAVSSREFVYEVKMEDGGRMEVTLEA